MIVDIVMEKYYLQSDRIIHSSNDSGLTTILASRTTICSYLAALPREDGGDDMLLFNPPGFGIRLDAGGQKYELDEPGTILVSADTQPEVRFVVAEGRVHGVEPVAVIARHPGWWEPYAGRPVNPSGYAGDEGVGIYKLSQRKDLRTGIPSSWTNDSVSSKPERAHGTIGLSYVRPKRRPDGGNKDELVPIYQNRPEESIHRHPRVSKYKPESNILGLSEFYVVLSGKVGIGKLDADKGTLTYYLLGKGEALRIDPEEIHGVLVTSRDFEYVCVQTPSCYHYPFDFNKHQFFYISELNVTFGYALISCLLKLEQSRDYLLHGPLTHTSRIVEFHGPRTTDSEGIRNQSVGPR